MTDAGKRKVSSFFQYLPSLALASVLLLAGGWKANVDTGIEINGEKTKANYERIADLQSAYRVRGERIDALESRIDALTAGAEKNTLILEALYTEQTGREWEE